MTPALTVASVAGSQRHRVQRLLDALAAQTVAAQIEVVLVDSRPSLDGLDPPDGLRLRILPGDSLSYGEARAMGARDARAEIVAFIEDHCYPEPGWAEALLAAYQQPWASVGYAIGSANPQTLSSRINWLAQYGQWLTPSRGSGEALPGNNVSYRRSALLELDSELAPMLGADYNVHARMRRRGLAVANEPDARVRHENEESVLEACRAGAVYGRQLASERARLGGWSWPRRIAHAVGILVGAPLMRLSGLLSASAGDRRRLSRIALYLPAILVIYLSGALGEAAGYLLGPGSSRERLMYWEVDAPRSGRS